MPVRRAWCPAGNSGNLGLRPDGPFRSDAGRQGTAARVPYRRILAPPASSGVTVRSPRAADRKIEKRRGAAQIRAPHPAVMRSDREDSRASRSFASSPTKPDCPTAARLLLTRGQRGSGNYLERPGSACFLLPKNCPEMPSTVPRGSDFSGANDADAHIAARQSGISSSRAPTKLRIALFWRRGSTLWRLGASVTAKQM